jgi:hypothetical protein
MALFICVDCGKEISDRAIKCPHCGFKTSQKSSLESQIEEVIDNGDKSRRRNKKLVIFLTGIILTLIILGIIILIAYGKYIENNNTVNYQDMSDREKIDVITQPFGQEVQEKEEQTTIEPDLYYFYQDAELFGYIGEIGHRYTLDGKTPPYFIDIAVWSTKNDFTDENFLNIIDSLEDLYGNDIVKVDLYEDITEVYEWNNVDNYAKILCGKSDKGKVVVRWYAKLTEENTEDNLADNTTDEPLEKNKEKYGTDTMVGYNSLVGLSNGSPVSVSGKIKLISANLYSMNIFVNDLDDVNGSNSSTTAKAVIYILDNISGLNFEDGSYLKVNGITDLSGDIPVITAEEIKDSTQDYLDAGGTME